MDQRNFALLSRKLEALHYNDPLDPNSAPLVQKLVDDLVHTTESYRALKMKNAKETHELDQWQGKLEVWKKDSERLLHENNQLHVQLIKQAENFDEDKKRYYLSQKKLEDQIADLAFWKAQHVSRYKQLEEQNSQLRDRVHDILRTGEKTAKADFDRREVVSRITVGHPLDPAKPRPSPVVTADTAALVQASEARVRSMEQQLQEAKTNAISMGDNIKSLEEKLSKRDLEIDRLGASVEQGRDLDRLNMEYRNEANESIILQLNQQVEFMTGQVNQLEDEARAKKQYEVALGAAESGRHDAETQLRLAMEENAQMRETLVQLKAQLQTCHQGGTHKTDALLGELTATNAQMSTLKDELAALRAQNESLVGQLMDQGNMEAAVAARGAELEDEHRQLKALLDIARGERDRMRTEAEEANTETQKLRGLLREKGDQLLEVERRAVQLQEDLDARHSNHRKVLVDKDVAEASEAEARAKINELKELVESRGSRLSEVISEAERTEAEVKRLKRLLAQAEDDVDTTARQASEARAAVLSLEARLSASEAEAQRQTRAAEASAARVREQTDAAETLQQQLDEAQREGAKLRSESQLLSAEAKLLRERAEDAGGQLALEEARSREASREKDALARLQPRLEELQLEVHHLTERLVNSETEVGQLRADTMKSSSKRQQAEQQVEIIRDELDACQAERDALRSQLKGFESQASSLFGDVSKWKQERERLAAELGGAVDEVARLKEALSAAEDRVAEAERHGVSLEHRAVALERDIVLREQEVESLRANSAHSSEAITAARQREDEAKAQATEAMSRAARSQQLAEEAQAELQKARSLLDMERVKYKEAAEQADEARSKSLQDSVEIERMRTVFTQLDSMREELVAKLKTKFSEVTAAEVRNSDLEEKLRVAQAEAEAMRAEGIKLSSVMESREAEHDRLQSELDGKAEQIAHMEEELEASFFEANEARRALAMAESRITQGDNMSRSAEEEIMSLQQQLDVQSQTLSSQQAELESKNVELRAVMEDLASVTREQQVVNSELMQATQDRDEARSELRATVGRQAHLEQLLRAKEREKEDLLRVYQELGAENSRLSSTIAQLERDASVRETQSSSFQQDNENLKEALQSQEAANHQYLLDLQAYERQVDSLSRQLSRKDNDLEEQSREARGLVEQLRAAAAVRFELERGREAQGRDAAQLYSQIEIQKARLQESSMEIQALTSKLQLESSHVREMEELVARMRAAEHNVYLGGEHTTSKEQALEEQNRLLERQIETLDKQVAALQDACTAQEKEIARLYSAQTTAPRPQGEIPVHRDAHSDGQLAAGMQHVTQAIYQHEPTASGPAEGLSLPAAGTAELVSSPADLQAQVEQLEAELALARESTRSVAGMLGGTQPDCAQLHRLTELEREVYIARQEAQSRLKALDSATLEIATLRKQAEDLQAQVQSLEHQVSAPFTVDSQAEPGGSQGRHPQSGASHPQQPAPGRPDAMHARGYGSPHRHAGYSPERGSQGADVTAAATSNAPEALSPGSSNTMQSRLVKLLGQIQELEALGQELQQRHQLHGQQDAEQTSADEALQRAASAYATTQADDAAVHHWRDIQAQKLALEAEVAALQQRLADRPDHQGNPAGSTAVAPSESPYHQEMVETLRDELRAVLSRNSQLEAQIELAQASSSATHSHAQGSQAQDDGNIKQSRFDQMAAGLHELHADRRVSDLRPTALHSAGAGSCLPTGEGATEAQRYELQSLRDTNAELELQVAELKQLSQVSATVNLPLAAAVHVGGHGVDRASEAQTREMGVINVRQAEVEAQSSDLLQRPSLSSTQASQPEASTDSAYQAHLEHQVFILRSSNERFSTQISELQQRLVQSGAAGPAPTAASMPLASFALASADDAQTGSHLLGSQLQQQRHSRYVGTESEHLRGQGAGSEVLTAQRPTEQLQQHNRDFEGEPSTEPPEALYGAHWPSGSVQELGTRQEAQAMQQKVRDLEEALAEANYQIGELQASNPTQPSTLQGHQTPLPSQTRGLHTNSQSKQAGYAPAGTTAPAGVPDPQAGKVHARNRELEGYVKELQEQLEALMRSGQSSSHVESGYAPDSHPQAEAVSANMRDLERHIRELQGQLVAQQSRMSSAEPDPQGEAILTRVREIEGYVREINEQVKALTSFPHPQSAHAASGSTTDPHLQAEAVSASMRDLERHIRELQGQLVGQRSRRSSAEPDPQDEAILTRVREIEGYIREINGQVKALTSFPYPQSAHAASGSTTDPHLQAEAVSASMRDLERHIRELQGQLVAQQSRRSSAEPDPQGESILARMRGLEGYVREINGQVKALTSFPHPQSAQAEAVLSRVHLLESLVRELQGQLAATQASQAASAYEPQTGAIATRMRELEGCVRELRGQLADLMRPQPSSQAASQAPTQPDPQAEGRHSQLEGYVRELQAQLMALTQSNAEASAAKGTGGLATEPDSEARTLLARNRDLEGSVRDLQWKLEASTRSSQAFQQSKHQELQLLHQRNQQLESALRTSQQDAAVAASQAQGAGQQIEVMRAHARQLHHDLQASRQELDATLSVAEAGNGKTAASVAIISELQALQERVQGLEEQLGVTQQEIRTVERGISRMSQHVTPQQRESPRPATQPPENNGNVESLQSRILDLQDALRASMGRESMLADLRDVQDAQAVASARFSEVEMRNAELAEEIRRLRAHAEGGQDEIRRSQAAAQELQVDNDRLLDILSKMDQERTQLQRENVQLIADIDTLRESSSSGYNGGGSRQTESPSIGTGVVYELRAQLRESEVHRRHLQEDFQKLMESMESMGDANSSGSSGKDDNGELRRKLKEMEAENLRLRRNLDSTRASMSRFQGHVTQSSGARGGH